MAISPQRLTIYLYSAHRAVIFAIAQLSCWSWSTVYGALHILWLKDKSWQTWTDFEKDLKKFELKTSTAYRIDKSDIVKTANNKRQRLLQGLIPEEVKYLIREPSTCAVTFGHCQSKTTGQRKCGRYVSIHHWQDDAIQDFFLPRAMHYSAKRGLAIACRLSVCPSVTLVDCDHIGWNSSKIISPSVSLGCSLFATPTSRVSKENIPKFSPD